MAQNWTITVGNPILTQGMSFFVRYRKMNDQNWVNFLPNPTTNTFTIPNLDDETNYEAEISTVCVNGDISLPVYHESAPAIKCISPTLSVSLLENTVTYSWSNNGFDYGTNGDVVIQISYDGNVWLSVGNALPNSGTFNYVLQSVPMNGMNVYYRIVTSGNGCSQESNIVSLVWNDNQSDIEEMYTEIIKATCRKSGFIVHCFGGITINFESMLGTSGFVKMTINGNTATVLSNALTVGAVINANTDVTFILNSVDTSGSGGLANTNYYPATYQFEYSANGSTNWIPFKLHVKAV